VLFVLVAPVLLGMIGLIVDAGMLMAAQRQTQNAADAAALAAAMDLYRGAPNSTALATAQTFVTNNGLSATLTLNGGASNALNIPPKDPGNTGSPYKNQANYVEAIVSQNVNTLFIQILGINSTQTVSARAVAGYEPVGSGEGAIVLNPNGNQGPPINGKGTGLNFGGNGRLVVNGTIVVNAAGVGNDQYGGTVGTISPGPAILTSNSQIIPAPVVARDVQVVGGVDNLANFGVYDPAFASSGDFYDRTNTDRPVFANAPSAPDPLVSKETPTTTSVGTYKVDPTNVLGNVKLTNGTLTLSPGIYSSMDFSGGTVTLNSGIYVLKGGGLTIRNNATVQLSNSTTGGVMFYLTGSDYIAASGLPDKNDGSTLGTTSTSFGSVTITGGTVTLAGLQDSTSPFNQMLFYQRRWNANQLSVGGAGLSINLDSSGKGSTTYAKWADFKFAGQGTYNAQFLVGSMTLTGNSTVTINATGKNFGKANLVFLVE
jgi:Flp pilus assembly protein TadG